VALDLTMIAIVVEGDTDLPYVRSLLRLARRAPASMRRKLLPSPGAAVSVGPLYEATLIEFGERAWDLARAARRSPSLQRARRALKRLARDWRAFVGD
jgi:hypothetical protein